MQSRENLAGREAEALRLLPVDVKVNLRSIRIIGGCGVHYPRVGTEFHRKSLGRIGKLRIVDAADSAQLEGHAAGDAQPHDGRRDKTDDPGFRDVLRPFPDFLNNGVYLRFRRLPLIPVGQPDKSHAGVFSARIDH